MTMKQIRNTGKMMRKSCQPKNNVSDEQIDPIAEGVFNEDKEVKCYMACIMKMANTIKNGKLNYEAAIKQADLLLPDDIKEPAKEAITACRKRMPTRIFATPHFTSPNVSTLRIQQYFTFHEDTRPFKICS
uniref:Odorant binding protein n=1 Tax=Heliothis virescens TaxID=7102 RepID=D2SNQ6_HELVI